MSPVRSAPKDQTLDPLLTTPRARLAHMSLAVRDTAAAAGFLETCFGFTPVFAETGMTGQIRDMTGQPDLACDICQLAVPGGAAIVELIAFHGPRTTGAAFGFADGAGGSHLALAVPQLDHAISRVIAEGAAVQGRVTQFADCRAVYCHAPGGLLVELEEMQAHG